MRKRWVALLLLSGCIAWPTTSENLPQEDGGTDSPDGGSVSGDGMLPTVCPPGGTVVASAKELYDGLMSLSMRMPDGNEHVFCLNPSGAPYALSEPLPSASATLGSVYFAPISSRVTVIGLGKEPRDTVLSGTNAPGAQPILTNPRCPTGSARFFFVESTGNLTLANLTLQGGCIQGARGGDAYNGAGGGGGSAGFGGAVAVKGGKLTIDRVSFRNNFAVGGLGGVSLSSITTPPGGGGGGGGMDTLGRTLTPDGATPPTNTKQYGGAGGGFEAGPGPMTGDAQSGSGSSGGGGGAGGQGTDTAKGGTGGAGGFLGGGGGGGGAALANISATAGNGGPSGFCGGGGGAGVAKSGMMLTNTAGGGGLGYAPFLGVAEMQAPACGDPGDATSSALGGTGGSGWGVGGAIFLAGGELTVVQLDPSAQTGNLALSPNRAMLRNGQGSFLFAIGTDKGQIPPFSAKGPVAAANLPGVVIIGCTMAAGCKTL